MKFLNSLVFTGMPDLGQYGFMSNHVIYGNVWNGVAVVPDVNGNNQGWWRQTLKFLAMENSRRM
jgi:hypothetical protein